MGRGAWTLGLVLVLALGPAVALGSGVLSGQTDDCEFALSYRNRREFHCEDGLAGRHLAYDIALVPTSGKPCASLAGQRVTEKVTSDYGCSPTQVEAGAGCVITADGTLAGCHDDYSICARPNRIPAAGCTEIWTQRLYVGPKLVETRRITWRLSRPRRDGFEATVDWETVP